MKIGSFRLSERQQVVGIIVLAGVGLFAIVYYLLVPQVRARRANTLLRQRMAADEYAHLSPDDLRLTAQHEVDLFDQGWQEWQETIQRLATFAHQDDLRKTEVGRIDFKVELFRQRQRLVRKSESLGISLLPTDLGMPDHVLQDAEARIMMIQLRAVEKLADLTLDRRIQRLISIEPLPPTEHNDLNNQHAFDEYPVKVEFEVSFENLYDLFHAVFEPEQIFVFRQIRVEAGATREAYLRVSAVMSALIFEAPTPPPA